MFRQDEYVQTEKERVTIRHRTLNDYTLSMQQARADKRAKPPLMSSRSSCKKATEWQGDVTNSGYEKMLAEGWRHGVEGVEELDGLASDASERLTFERNVGGAFANVPAFLHGAPDAMLMPARRRNENMRGLTLVLDASFSAGVAGDTVLEYAQSVMKLVAWLEAERIETAVYVTIAMYMESDKYIYVTPIREAGMTMQPERIAAILHPAFLRRAWFSLLEQEHVLHHLPGARESRFCYGHVTHADVEEMQACLPESYSVIMLPKPGRGDPVKAVHESINLKLRLEQ